MARVPSEPDRPTPERLRVLVVGAGFSGTLVTIHLLRSGRPVDVRLTDVAARFGPGLAHGTHRPEHLLNVPAGGMSAFPEAPDDFLAWTAARGAPAASEDFVPRSRYGDYLADRLEEAVRERPAGASVDRVRARVRDVATRPGGRGLRAWLEGGEVVDVDRVVLAWGNLPPLDPLAGIADGLGPDRYARDPWSRHALEGIEPSAGVLVVGTGLTSVDAVLELLGREHRGPVVAVSRRGHVPRSHRREGRLPPESLDPAPLLAAEGSLRALVRAFRAQVRVATVRGGDWRDVVAAVRPVTPRLWASLDARSRARFVRHLRPLWDAHRHRTAPAVGDAIAAAVAASRLAFRAGRVTAVKERVHGVEVRLRRRGGARETLRVARIVNATGACNDLARSPDPLVAALRAHGTIRPDPLGLGLATEPDGGVLSRDGARVLGLFALGPMRQGSTWESVAVPELRVQARDVAARLLTGE